jgi:hypothetical protein
MTDSPWRPIATAPPTDGRTNVRIDILAKMWRPKVDDFLYVRFPDCYWAHGDSTTNRRPRWHGVEDGWRAVAWMPTPPIPESYP